MYTVQKIYLKNKTCQNGFFRLFAVLYRPFDGFQEFNNISHGFLIRRYGILTSCASFDSKLLCLQNRSKNRLRNRYTQERELKQERGILSTDIFLQFNRIKCASATQKGATN